MTSTIQNISNINQSNFFMKAPVAENSITKQSENVSENNQHSKEDSFYNAKTIIASLSGLAVIGGVIWKIKSGKSKSAEIIPLENSKNRINEITERITELRKTIKEEYFAKKQKLVEDMNNFDEFDDKIPFTNPKDLYNMVQERHAAYIAKSEKLKGIIEKKSKEIKAKIKELEKNQEWRELLKLRKAIIKDLGNCTTEDEAKILNDKVIMVNDLLINRVYPEEMVNYPKFIGLEDKKAFELVRKNFSTYSDFMEEYESSLSDFSEPLLDNANTRFIQKDALKLKYIFPKEMSVINTNKKALTNTRKAYEAAERTYKKYKTKKQQLNSESQQSENVRELKQLIKELKSLEAENKTKIAA